MNSRIAAMMRLRVSNTLPRIGVDDEIEIALAVADLDVGQAVPLLGQRQQALREEVQPRRPDRELVGLGAEQASLDADPVAEIEQLVDLEVELRQRVLPDVDLDPRVAVGQHEEVGLAEGADREDAAAGDRCRRARASSSSCVRWPVARRPAPRSCAAARTCADRSRRRASRARRGSTGAAGLVRRESS